MKIFDNSRFMELKAETDPLVEEFLKKNKITQCPPANARGNETAPHNHRAVVKMRAEWRKEKRAQDKANKEALAENLRKQKLEALKGGK